MKLIVGLGNPGAGYERTRHNIGWQVVDAFASKFRITLDQHEKEAMIGRGRVAGGSVMLARPMTYMNASGHAVKLLCGAYVETVDDLMVVYDDVDLPLGKLRIRAHGSSGTHNGMRSIVTSLASERFSRLRFGVRGASYSETDRLRDYVLEEFLAEELPLVTVGIARAVDALVLFARDDLRRAMNEYNRDPEGPETAGKADESPKKDPNPS